MGWLKILGIFMLVILALALITAGGLKSRFNRQFEAEIAKIKARGEPVTAADLVKEEIPDSENAALVYEQVCLEMDNPVVRADLRVLADMPGSKIDQIDAKSWKAYSDAVRRSGRLRSLIEDAASKPKCRFIRDYSGGFNIPFPHFARLRETARFLRADALVSAHEGRMDDAARAVGTQFKVAEALKDGPSLIDQLVRFAILAIASKTMENCLAYGDFSEQQARHLYDILATIDLADGYVKAFQGERVLFLTMVEQSKSEIGGLVVTDYEGHPAIETALQRTLGTLHNGVSLKGDMALYLRHMAENIEAAKLSYREAKASGVLHREPEFPFYAPVASVMAPVFSRSTDKRCTSSVKIAGDRILLALMVYKSRFGAYPRTLGELESALGWKLPKDTYSDEDFKYRREGKGYLLYSVGPNMKDDGGVQHDTRFFAHDEKGDFVWRRK